eukprot:TRINITY_DN2031_c0_g2_i3.p1 TRINITY_DN2031_c0_g2~~TRINITY_DN2031_c0_g2_i3.p1  ORF type:complete len:916 (-),score=369.95 TRINITY_DN2031_c0_g2_i3:827-3574(-)
MDEVRGQLIPGRGALRAQETGSPSRDKLSNPTFLRLPPSPGSGIGAGRVSPSSSFSRDFRGHPLLANSQGYDDSSSSSDDEPQDDESDAQTQRRRALSDVQLVVRPRLPSRSTDASLPHVVRFEQPADSPAGGPLGAAPTAVPLDGAQQLPETAADAAGRTDSEEDADDEVFGLEFSEPRLTYQHYMAKRKNASVQAQLQAAAASGTSTSAASGGGQAAATAAAAEAQQATADEADGQQPQLPKYARLIITKSELEESDETVESCGQLLEALHIRRRWLDPNAFLTRPFGAAPHPPTPPQPHPPTPPPPQPQPAHPPAHQHSPPPADDASAYEFEMRAGLFTVFADAASRAADRALLVPPSLADYYRDLNRLLHICTSGPTKTMCFRRLRLLDAKFNLHILLNEESELAMARSVPHRDFYNVHKVDTHVHHSSSMNHKKLLKFIKRKLKQCPDETVIFRDGKHLTLRQVFDSLQLSAYDLSVDTLDVHADNKMFHRFDRFNLKYSPCGQSRLREIFLKTDNFIKGRYLAELTHEIFGDLMTARYQSAEYRISIYGRNGDEWDKLAGWVLDHKLHCPNVRWMVQIPRLYGDFKELGMVSSFAQLLSNIFTPLFEVTKDPSSHPKLHLFLQQVSGFDCVDDESKPEKKVHNKYPTPELWDIAENPNYTYYCFYLAANLRTLNALRQLRGFSTLTFRPHAGEAGELDHLASAFTLAHGISHGINLRKSPVLQYLYYLEQVGIAMSPLSNNSLFLNYHRNPFPVFFARGLNVSLSTDDPLQFHYSSEPLIEEYSIAAQVWKLSSVDLCEIARNSVLQSGFDDGIKVHWLGRNYHLPGVSGNNIDKTNVPNIRIAFRHESLVDEFYFLYEALRGRPTKMSFSPITDRLSVSKISEESKIEEAIAERQQADDACSTSQPAT